jgi:transposase-like protein
MPPAFVFQIMPQIWLMCNGDASVVIDVLCSLFRLFSTRLILKESKQSADIDETQSCSVIKLTFKGDKG